MPRIDTYKRSVPLATVGQPQIPSGWFTDEYRAQAGAAQAEAQFGQALGQAAQVVSNTIGGLIQQLQDRQARTEIRKANVEMSTKTTALLAEHTDPQWRDSQYGTGFIANPDGTPSEIKKKPLSQYAQDFIDKYDKIRDDVFSKSFSAAPESMRQQWLAGINIDRNQQALKINGIQVRVAQQQAELAVYEVAQAHIAAHKAGQVSAEDAMAGIEQAKQRGYATGDLAKTIASEKQFDAMIDEVEANEKRLEQEKKEGVVGLIVEHLNSTNLTYDQKLEVINQHTGLDGGQKRDAVSQINIGEAANKIRQEREAEKQRGDFFARMSSPNSRQTVDRNYIQSLDKLSQKERQQMLEWTESIAASQAKGQKNIFEISDPVVQLAVMQEIHRSPESRTKQGWRAYIYSWAGKGLSIGDVEHYVAMANTELEALKPGAMPIPDKVKRSRKFLADLQKIHTDELKDEDKAARRQELLRWVDINIEYDEWAKNQGKDASEEEHRAKVTALTEPIREEIKLGLFTRLVTFDLPARQRQLLTQKRTKALMAESVWQSWTEQEQADARRLLGQGKTINETIRAITTARLGGGQNRQPTARELMNQAIGQDEKTRRQIYERGKNLGYWE